MDDLRNRYEGALDWVDVAAEYSELLARYGFERIMESPLGTRRKVDVEMFLADTVGARTPLRNVTAFVDARRAYNLLPLNKALAEYGEELDPDLEADLEYEQEEALDDYTYDEFAETYLSRDPWFVENHTGIQEVDENHLYSELLDEISGGGIPVLTLISSDDYILNAENLAALKRHEGDPNSDQITHFFEHGGHIGMIFHPQIRKIIGDFVQCPPNPSGGG